MDIEELVKQCLDSGWFQSEEKAREYVMTWCVPKTQPAMVDEVKDVFEDKKPLRLEELP